MKKLLFIIPLFFLACGGGGESSKTTSSNISSQQHTNTKKETDKYYYIPKKISDKVAVRFLNKATFGATPESVEDLKQKGIINWLNEQLNMPNEEQKYLKNMIKVAKAYSPIENNETIENYLADNDIIFNKKGSFDAFRYRISSWYKVALHAKTQLREKTAYVLSQIIVESEASPALKRRAEGIANYFDILSDNAFGNYKTILKKISLSPSMGVYLTYVGNKKAYYDNDTLILPDENYAREIMQLFSLGVYLLNMDGSAVIKNGKKVPVYTQEDINELSRVFTGWDIKRSRRYGSIDGDFYHEMEFTEEYHDFGSKKILGKTIPANLSGEEDIEYALDIICSHQNLAPYISKKLIKRFTKSNPSKEYVQRVAEVFKNTNGNLKEVIKAIFLDKEFWDDLLDNKWEKFKEPQIAFTQMLRALNISTLSFYRELDENTTILVEDTYWFNNTYSYLNQGPGMSPTVFNFYDDEFIPRDEYFEKNNLTAPELQIQDDIQMINFSNYLQKNLLLEKNNLLSQTYSVNGESKKFDSLNEMINEAPNLDPCWLKNIFFYKFQDKYILDLTDELKVLEREIDGDEDGDFENLKDCRDGYTNYAAIRALVDYEDKKLLGGMLSEDEKETLVKGLGKCMYKKGRDKKVYLYQNVIAPLLRVIVGGEKYMRE